MNFQTLLKVEDDDFYIGKAFRNATKRADSAREKKFNSGIAKSRYVELERIKGVKQELEGDLGAILRSFPSIDELPEFYLELVKVTTDYGKLKKSLGAVKWSGGKIGEFYRIYAQKIARCNDAKQINDFRRMFYGRAASALKQIRKELVFLEECRRKMKAFPSIKTGIRTIVIAGYPNVGKTTLLRKLTSADPKVAPYPFTTQQIMIGYFKKGEEKIQVVDTPGLLDRDFEKRNKIEKQAVLALKYLADKLIFIIDASETCGYSLETQLRLFNEVKNNFKSEIIVMVNKADIAEKEKIGGIRNKIRSNKVLVVSAEKGEGIELLAELL